MRHINNKENINVNNINVINSKIDKEREENSVSKNNKSSVLKTIEKSSSGLSIHSRLFTEIDNKSIIKLIEKDDKSNSNFNLTIGDTIYNNQLLFSHREKIENDNSIKDNYISFLQKQLDESGKKNKELIQMYKEIEKK